DCRVAVLANNAPSRRTKRARLPVSAWLMDTARYSSSSPGAASSLSSTTLGPLRTSPALACAASGTTRRAAKLATRAIQGQCLGIGIVVEAGPQAATGPGASRQRQGPLHALAGERIAEQSGMDRDHAAVGVHPRDVADP